MISASTSENLEVTRGLAAFVVLIAHSCQWFIWPIIGYHHPVVTALQYAAHVSVLLFFVISGYVICHSLVLNARRNGYIDGVSFTISRLARILPPALFAWTLSLLVGVLIIKLHLHGAESFRLEGDLALGRQSITLNWRNVMATLFLSNGIIPGTRTISTNGPLWSLSLESGRIFWR